MMTPEQIRAAIEALPIDQRWELSMWLSKTLNELWDREMEEDAKSGKFDEIIKEVDAEMETRRQRKLRFVS